MEFTIAQKNVKKIYLKDGCDVCAKSYKALLRVIIEYATFKA